MKKVVCRAETAFMQAFSGPAAAVPSTTRRGQWPRRRLADHRHSLPGKERLS